MKQTEIAKWLKGVAYAIAVMGVVFFFYLVPVMAGHMKQEYPEAACLYVPGLVYNWIAAVFCYAILFQFWKVCREIGRDNSFSKENADAFKMISRLAAVMAAVWFFGFTGLIVVRIMQPGILLFMIFAVFISIAVTVCAAALSHLILKAYELRQENELTI